MKRNKKNIADNNGCDVVSDSINKTTSNLKKTGIIIVGGIEDQKK